MSVLAYSLGAAETVTGSKHVLEVNGKIYFVDFGSWQGGAFFDELNKTFEFPADKIESIFISHAHYDHVGLLPKIVKNGYAGKIYSTPATRDLASIILFDSAKIQLHEKNGPIYEEKDVIEAMNHFRCAVYKKEKKINDNISITFYNAGHILGSAMIDINLKQRKWFKKKDLHILYTGDLGRENNPICEPPATDMPAPDYIFMESTYGNRTHENIETVYQELTYIVNRTIERGGKVIIPSFAVERAQEIIYFLKVLMKEGKIPRVPVYVDSPMASNATGVFNIHPECFNSTIRDKFISQGKNPFSIRTLKFVSDYNESLSLAKSKKPAIVISASGMADNGRILSHLKYGIENPNNTILIVGYMAENTLGRKILDKCEKVTIDKQELTLKAEVQKINAFSAHADYKEMSDWLSKIDASKLKKIFLVHGEKDSQEFFKNHLTNLGYNVEIVKSGVNYKLF